MTKKRSLKTLPLDGGAIPFHFINTVYAWRGPNLHEYINDYRDVLEWCGKVKLLPSRILKGLEIYAHDFPGKAEDALKQLKEIRLLLFQLFSGIAGNKVGDRILQSFNTVLTPALKEYAWVKQKKGIQYLVQENMTQLLLPASIVLKYSHDLIINGDLERIKECPLCGWIFLDSTKNNKRKWCNPATCGSVEKTSRYYQKTKKERSIAN